MQEKNRGGRKKGFKNPNAGRKKIAVIPASFGIPPKVIIMDQVLYWIGLQATAQEIASSFRVHPDTLEARLLEHFGLNFSELKKRTDGEGKLSLRRYQFQQSEKNATMAIWLGKQWLGQRDKDDEDRKNSPEIDIADLKLLAAKQQILIMELQQELDALKPKAA